MIPTFTQLNKTTKLKLPFVAVSMAKDMLRLRKLSASAPEKRAVKSQSFNGGRRTRGKEAQPRISRGGYRSVSYSADRPPLIQRSEFYPIPGMLN
ncbi:hypothetical protein AVEN_178593-1 [Araneus ventricosus]|uniref:Uncharacterized protein n=1 Tax=Araneus ventricosus TaxID=182803 RepID=A0A4Y2WNY4_ARAVE|nr:hypothetical protein AVEN_178593-1 [Araneus ventricosus]